jgi:hypothetical protein
LSSDAFTLMAMSLLEKLCDGNPGRLHYLASCAIRASQTANSPRVAAAHVRQAAAPHHNSAPESKPALRRLSASGLRLLVEESWRRSDWGVLYPATHSQPEGEAQASKTNGVQSASQEPGRIPPGAEPPTSAVYGKGSAWELLTRAPTPQERARNNGRRKLKAIRALPAAAVAAAACFAPSSSLCVVLPTPRHDRGTRVGSIRSAV